MQQIFENNKVDEEVTGENYPSVIYDTETGGWLQSSWYENDPYNKYCPYSKGSRCLGGSLAISMAQIIHYKASNSDKFDFKEFTESDNYVSIQGELKIKIFEDAKTNNFPSINELNLKLAALKKAYEERKFINDDLVAYLVFACGVAVKQNYGTTYTSQGLNNIVKVLVDRFGFSKNIKVIYYPSQNFFSPIDVNIKNKAPILFQLLSKETKLKKYIVADGSVKAIIDSLTSYTGYHLNFGEGSEIPKLIKQSYWYDRDPMLKEEYHLDAAYVNLFY